MERRGRRPGGPRRAAGPTGLVGEAIAAAIADPDTPLRVPMGTDAEMVLAARASLDDAAFTATMREVLGITW